MLCGVRCALRVAGCLLCGVHDCVVRCWLWLSVVYCLLCAAFVFAIIGCCV